MHPRRRPLKSPGGPPLSEQRRLCIELMSKNVSNTAACRIVGVNRRTGTRWRRGRTVTNRAGQPRTYEPIIDRGVGLSNRWLTEGERIIIADGLLAGRTVRAIATELGRSPSTVSREIRRNCDPVSGRYFPFRAHRRSIERRPRPRTGKLADNAELRAVVQDCLDRRWSPEQIAETLRVDCPVAPRCECRTRRSTRPYTPPGTASCARRQPGSCERDGAGARNNDGRIGARRGSSSRW